MLVLLFVLSAAFSWAEALVAVTAGTLPFSLNSAAGFYDGQDSIYILGGSSRRKPVSDIQRYDLNTQTVETVSNFPQSISNGGVGTDGNGTFFYFGGLDDTLSRTDNIYALTAQNTTAQLVGTLPNKLSQLSAASDLDGNVYLSGGNPEFSGDRGWIVRFDTRTYESENYFNTSLDLIFATGTWIHGSGLYIFGGYDDDYPFDSTDVRTLSPPAEFGVIREALPYGASSGTVSVTVGKDVWLIGGAGQTENFRRFNTETRKTEVLQVVNRPKELEYVTAVYVEKSNRIYCFGGSSLLGSENKKIFYIQL